MGTNTQSVLTSAHWGGQVQVTVESHSSTELTQTLQGVLDLWVIPPAQQAGSLSSSSAVSAQGTIEGAFQMSATFQGGNSTGSGSATLLFQGTLQSDNQHLLIQQMSTETLTGSGSYTDGAGTPQYETHAIHWPATTLEDKAGGELLMFFTSTWPSVFPDPGILLDLTSGKQQTFIQSYSIQGGSCVVNWQITLKPPYVIKRDNLTNDAIYSFVSTDMIDLHVEITGLSSDNLLADWAVTGESLNSGNGNPSQQSQSHTFSFHPNPTARPTSGSTLPNTPIAYDVQATIDGNAVTYSLIQDETDTMRQEYIDYKASTIPTREQCITPTNDSFNTGNYSLILDGGLQQALSAVTQGYFNLLNASPSAGGISITSAYRNPQRNVAAGSKYPITSRHVWGSALDLAPSLKSSASWQALHQAGANVGSGSICEHGATQLDSTSHHIDYSEFPADEAPNHVHVQFGASPTEILC